MEGLWRFSDARVLTKAELAPFISQPLSAYLAGAKKHLAEWEQVDLNDGLFSSGFLISHPVDTPLPPQKRGALFISRDILPACPHLHAAELEILYLMGMMALLTLIRKSYNPTGCRQGVQTLGGAGAWGAGLWTKASSRQHCRSVFFLQMFAAVKLL